MRTTVTVTCNECGEAWRNTYFIDRPTREEPGVCELEDGEETCLECGSTDLDMTDGGGDHFDPSFPF